MARYAIRLMRQLAPISASRSCRIDIFQPLLISRRATITIYYFCTLEHVMEDALPTSRRAYLNSRDKEGTM